MLSVNICGELVLKLILVLVGIFKYLPMDLDIAQRQPQYGSGALYVYGNRQGREILKWWILCALESECMNPTVSDINSGFISFHRVRD